MYDHYYHCIIMCMVICMVIWIYGDTFQHKRQDIGLPIKTRNSLFNMDILAASRVTWHTWLTAISMDKKLRRNIECLNDMTMLPVILSVYTRAVCNELSLVQLGALLLMAYSCSPHVDIHISDIHQRSSGPIRYGLFYSGYTYK